MSSRRASCSCGQLSLEVDGEPIRVSVCHCLACQQRTGSVFAAQARWPSASVRVSGTASCWTRTTDAGNQTAQYFCATCGSTVHYTSSTAPDVIAVPVGAFADPTFPRPTRSVYEERMHPWVALGGILEHID